VEAGFRSQEPTAFTVEGLTAYLTEDDVTELLARLADLGPTGSRLAVSFESGFERQPITRLLSTAYYRRGGEQWRFRLRSEDAPSFLPKTGWTIDNLLTAPSWRADTSAGRSSKGRSTPRRSSWWRGDSSVQLRLSVVRPPMGRARLASRRLGSCVDVDAA